MKKYLFTLLIVLLASPVFAAGTCTTPGVEDLFDETYRITGRLLTYTCTGDADDGSFPATVMGATDVAKLKNWFLYKVITNPGGTAPTDNWDLAITDGDGIDVLGGAGANRHTTTSQMFAPLISTGVLFAQPVLDTWTLAITGNSVNSAIIVLKLLFER